MTKPSDADHDDIKPEAQPTQVAEDQEGGEHADVATEPEDDNPAELGEDTEDTEDDGEGEGEGE
jgi:hypothetical protein